MASFRGIELHRFADDPRRWCPDAAVDSFYRIVRSGRMVQVRWGRRGTPGTSRTTEFPHSRSALQYYETKRVERLAAGYRTVFASPVIPVTDEHAVDPDGCFLDQWTEEVLALLWGRVRPSRTAVRSRQWVLVCGLLAERGLDHGADTLYAQLTRGPHAIDLVTDRVVGQLVRTASLYLPGVPGGLSAVTRMDHIGRRLSSHVLCPTGHLADGLGGGLPEQDACATCDDRMAALLLHQVGTTDLASLSPEHRVQLGIVARRLAHL